MANTNPINNKRSSSTSSSNLRAANHKAPPAIPSQPSVAEARRLLEEAEERENAEVKRRETAAAAKAAGVEEIVAAAVRAAVAPLEARLAKQEKKRPVKPSENWEESLPGRDYGDTEHVQNQIESVMKKNKGVVRLNELEGKITATRGSSEWMTASSLRNHLKKMAVEGRLYLGHEAAKEVRGKHPLRFVAASDPYALVEALEAASYEYQGKPRQGSKGKAPAKS